MSWGEIALWNAVLVVALLAALRIRSLVSPRAFPPWMGPILEGPLRRRFDRAEDTLRASGLEPGMRVLEVGPGTGYLTRAAVDVVGAGGRMVCLDLQPEFLRKVRARLGARAPLLVCASGSSLPFRDGSFDLVYLVSVLGEIPDKRAAVAEYHRVLRAGGTLAVSERAVDPDYVRTPVLRRLAESAGFRRGERTGGLINYTHRFARP